MKKILFVCDVNNFPKGAFKFIENLKETDQFLLTGAFFHSANFDIVMPASVAFAPDPIVAFTDTDVEAVAGSIEKFKQKCEQSGIEYLVHEESDTFQIEDFVKETRFADVAVVSEELFFIHIDAEQPNSYLKEVLHRSECPVLVIPENYTSITNVAIAYDGKKESMFAVKQFCYLFPQYTTLPTHVLYWVHKTDDEIPDMEYIEEFASRHFTNLDFKEIFFDQTKYMADWSRKNRNTIVISGSYKRSGLSTLLEKNFVDDMIKHPSSVIFIAHNC